jgi:hypothetical protein
VSASHPDFPGARILRGEPRYPTMVQGFNRRWVGDPEYVQVCGNTAQVVKTVQQAVDRKQRITVRGGGHCYENFVCDNQDGVIIDLSPMNGVYGTGGESWWVEGGATLWNVYGALYRDYGVTLPGGSCYSVGVGGHVTGGGYGLLSRLHGLTIDYLHGVEMVWVNGDERAEVVTVTADSKDPAELDLLWANQGGGGGNFGIVTRFLFAGLPAAPTEAWLLSRTWRWSALGLNGFAELIARYGEFLCSNSAPSSDFAGLFSLLHLFPKVERSPEVTLTAQYVGQQPQLLEEFLGQLEDIAQARPAPARIGLHQTPLGGGGSIQRLPWLLATQTLNGSGPNRYGKYKSAYMTGSFREAEIEAMYRHLNGPEPNPAALLQVDSYGCQINAVASQATAIPQRSSVMKLQYQTYWSDSREEDANLAWIGDFYEDMYGASGPRPDGTLDGCYVNYPDVDLPDWQHLYYQDGYPRLQRAKARWDPLDVFRHVQSIELP